jgi:dTDP-4-amino-4,6-dideoxygalactose transaminase
VGPEAIGVSPSGVKEQADELRDDLLAATARVLDSGWFVLGEEVEAFEREFATWTRSPHAVGVASGTDALTLALRACGVGPGHEVIVPANALPAAYGVAASGARIRFADVRRVDLNLDPAEVERLTGPHTAAILAVHLYGHPADVDELASVVDRDRVAIIEDCAQAHGARLRGDPVGTLGDAAAWSFYPTKNLGAVGDGGAVTTGDEALAARVRSLRVFGEQRRYCSTEVGVNSRLDELQAALLRVKLPRLDGWVRERRRVAAVYDSSLEALDGVVAPPLRADVEHARHLYPLEVKDRDAVLSALREQGIPAAVHYPRAAHDQPCFTGWRERDLPVTEALCDSLVSLPIHPYVSNDEAIRIGQAVEAAVSV